MNRFKIVLDDYEMMYYIVDEYESDTKKKVVYEVDSNLEVITVCNLLNKYEKEYIEHSLELSQGYEEFIGMLEEGDYIP